MGLKKCGECGQYYHWTKFKGGTVCPLCVEDREKHSLWERARKAWSLRNPLTKGPL